MKNNIPEFDVWANENGFDISRAEGIGYISTATANAHKAWKGYQEQVNEVLYEYGICTICGVHYRPVENIGPENYRMECNCSIDRFRRTKIIEFMGC